MGVSDENGFSNVDSTSVTVLNVLSSVTTLTSDAPVDENSPVIVSGVISDPGWLENLTATIDWGDGTITETVYLVNPPDLDPPLSPSIQPRDVQDLQSHTYADEYGQAR